MPAANHADGQAEQTVEVNWLRWLTGSLQSSAERNVTIFGMAWWGLIFYTFPFAGGRLSDWWLF